MSYSYFGQFGEVSSVVFDHRASEKVIIGTKCAFITFEEEEGANKAIEAVNETYIDGYLIRFVHYYYYLIIYLFIFI
jgi:RNA recognition motif-containing protein